MEDWGIQKTVPPDLYVSILQPMSMRRQNVLAEYSNDNITLESKIAMPATEVSIVRCLATTNQRPSCQQYSCLTAVSRSSTNKHTAIWRLCNIVCM